MQKARVIFFLPITQRLASIPGQRLIIYLGGNLIQQLFWTRGAFPLQGLVHFLQVFFQDLTMRQGFFYRYRNESIPRPHFSYPGKNITILGGLCEASTPGLVPCLKAGKMLLPRARFRTDKADICVGSITTKGEPVLGYGFVNGDSRAQLFHRRTRATGTTRPGLLRDHYRTADMSCREDDGLTHNVHLHLHPSRFLLLIFIWQGGHGPGHHQRSLS